MAPWPNVNVVDGTLFFNGGSSSSLWKTDGTTSGTVAVKNIWPRGNGSCGYSNTWSAATVGSTFYFVAFDLAHFYQVWKSDGTDSGTVIVRPDMFGGQVAPTWNLTDAGGTLFFTASDPAHGSELWKSDGTETGTIMVKDIKTGWATSAASEFVYVPG